MTYDFSYVRLGDHVQFDKRQSLGMNLPYVGLEDIESQTGKFIGSFDSKHVKSATFLFDERHVLYGRLRAYLNKYLTPTFNGHCSTEIFPLLPDSKINRFYLAHWLSSPNVCDLIDATGRGARMPRANMNEVLNFQFPLPPLDEQKRIVAKLDEALGDLDRLTENSKRTLDQIDALWVASIDEVMNEISSGTQMSTIGDIFKTSSGGTPLKSRKDYYEGGSVPWLLSGEVANSEITSAKNFITELALKETSAKLAPSNSVLVAMYGATAGEVGILRFEASTNQAVCAIHPIEGWNTEFIYYWMVYSKNHLISMAAGNAQPNVSQIKIRSLPIPLLDQRSQDNVVSRLSEIKKSQEETYLLKRQSMSEQNLLRGSILSAAFAGDF